MSDNNTHQNPAHEVVSGAQQHQLKPDWTIGEVLSEAWKLKDGFKGTYWGALVIFIVINLILAGVFQLIGNDTNLMKTIAQAVTAFLTYPLFVGLLMLAIKRSAGVPTSASMVLDYYPKTVPIFLTYLLMMVMIVIGFVLLVFPGIYLAVAYMLALPLLVDKKLGIWEALETSRKAITPCWFRVFGLSLIISVILAISAIPLGIGLIWTLPFAGLAMGIVYRDVVGFSQSS
jgi:uncharacterized membrane protein